MKVKNKFMGEDYFFMFDRWIIGHKRYCKYVKDDSRIYVGNGFASKY